MALFDCGLMITAYYGMGALLAGEDPPKYGNAHPSIIPYGVFDPLRGANRALLVPELNREIARRPRKELLEKLAAADIPCGEELGLHEALTSERTVRGGLVTTRPHPETASGTVPVLSPPYRFDGVRTPVRSAPPQLGKDTGEVLQELLGLSGEKLAHVQAAGVTGQLLR